jgi:hypothetical protein
MLVTTKIPKLFLGKKNGDSLLLRVGGIGSVDFPVKCSLLLDSFVTIHRHFVSVYRYLSPSFHMGRYYAHAI